MTLRYDVEFNSAAHYPAQDVPDLAERAEAAGFGAYWKGESNSTDPLVLLSAIAARPFFVARRAVPRSQSHRCRRPAPLRPGANLRKRTGWGAIIERDPERFWIRSPVPRGADSFPLARRRH